MPTRERRQGDKEKQQAKVCVEVLEARGFPMTEREIAQMIKDHNLCPLEGKNIQRTVSARLCDYYNSRGLEEEDRVPIVIKRIAPATWVHKKGKHPPLEVLLERCKQLQSQG